MRMRLLIAIFTGLSHSLKIGLIDSDNVTMVCRTALQEAANNQHCVLDTIEIEQREGCVPDRAAKGTINAAELYYNSKVNGFVAPMCLDELDEMGRLAYFWKRPVFARSLASTKLMNTDIYPTVIQVSPSTSAGFGKAIIELALKMNEKTITLVGPSARSEDHYPIAVAVNDYLTYNNVIGVKKNLQVNENDGNYADTSRDMQTSTKILVVGTDFLDVKTALDRLDINKLTSMSFVVILICIGPIEDCFNADTKNAVISSGSLVLAPNIENYMGAIQNFSTMVQQQVQGNFNKYMSLYTACYGYCYGAKEGGTGDTQSFYQIMRYKQFRNSLGTFKFDGAGALLQDYFFYMLSKDQDSAVMKVYAQPSECINFTCFTVTSEIIGDQLLNMNKSVIEQCILMGTCESHIGIILGVFGGVITLSGIAIFWFIRRRPRGMYRMHWRIPKEMVKIIENTQANFKATKAGEGLSTKRRVIASYALMGANIKAEFIALKHLKRIKWTRPELKFLFELKQLNHDNLTKFYGICCNELDTFYVLHALIERASLEDFVKDPDFNMDSVYKSAFLRDILKGLQYLHKSAIGCHGLLITKHCLIDTNWVLKLTNFGISSMLHEFVKCGVLHPLAENHLSTEYFPMFAPELLRETSIGDNYPRGTPQGDVYCMGMILYWLLYRTDPFEKTGLKGKSLVNEICKKNIKPEVEDGDPEALLKVIRDCFNSVPESRPKLKTISQTVTKAFASTKGNLVDQMIRMNEKYAQNLEQIVAERNSMLQEAQEQTDRLLNEMLPVSIASTLKAGGAIPPRSYESATVLFVQLCDFPALVGRSGPEEVIMFLNDIFDRFDGIIKRHDAYKVETTGETYMVASGVPSENDGRHVIEIAEISLEIREESYVYKVTHCPEFQVSVRIGFHCGPIAAGVIGIRSPRYCLFGDTVNFASRMQSNCPPNQIQTSEATAMKLMTTEEYSLVKRGIVHVKGKGEVNCYWLNEHIHDCQNDHPVPPQVPPRTGYGRK